MADLAISSPLIVAIDQGTSSTKVIVVDAGGAVVAQASVAIGAAHPQAGWVEQDANEIATSVVDAVAAATEGITDRVVGVGLSSQRESALIWDRATGEPLGPLLGWQDRRTRARAADLTEAGHSDLVREITGLPIDPMFSALKLAWLLDAADPDRVRSNAGEIAAGTVDSWLLFRLTGEHRIEVGNASRTQLLSLDTLDWDDRLLDIFGVPGAVLPTVVASSAPSAPVRGLAVPTETRILAVLGDSHAALFAHGVRTPGEVKVTYGTGSSVMGLVSADGVAGVQRAGDGLVTTVAWSTDAPAYAFEGNILSTGSTLVWLADVLGTTPAALIELAADPSAGHGVNLVPAFAGLGAPWWDENAQALISGISLGTTRADLARSAVESIALQIEDVLAAADTGAHRVERVLVDGGPSSNDALMQLQADLSDRTIERPGVAELSALGAAHLAGIGTGLWTEEQVLALPKATTTFTPDAAASARTAASVRRRGWRSAVDLSRGIPVRPDASIS